MLQHRLSVACAGLVVALAGPATAAEHTVRMAGMSYQPAAIRAEVGDTIRFVNDDATNHDVFVPTKGFGVDLGTQEPGQTTELKLGKPGAFEAECVIHPQMLLKVEVVR